MLGRVDIQHLRNAMSMILQRNKENFEHVAGTTDKKFFAVNLQNHPWPSGLRRKRYYAVLKSLRIAPLFPVGFALHSTVSAMQHFHAVNVDTA